MIMAGASDKIKKFYGAAALDRQDDGLHSGQSSLLEFPTDPTRHLMRT